MIYKMKIQHVPHDRGFALVATVSMMVLLTLVAIAMLSLSTIEQRSSGGSANEADRMARANARMALMMALGELQKAAGPDQRITATATILGSATNPYATGTTAADGRKHWLGVWNTNGYSPADPDNKTFVRWLVSGDQNQLDTIADAGTAAADDFAIFEGVDAAGNADPSSTVKVPKVEVATATAGNSSYYAYWVEDQGVKVDLAWNEGSYADADRQQAARLSASPGPDHAVFDGPFSSGVNHPLEKGSGYVDKLQKAFSPADMPLVMADTADHSTWLKANRHDMAMNVRGVITDVKKGGLRRDLSLAFEMDGIEDSENATIFNQQTTEFVGNGDQQSSPWNMPGVYLNLPNVDPEPLKARHLFRDLPSAGDFFSDDITQPRTVVRGPSWWLLRDYANLYKRLNTSVVNDDAGNFLYNTHEFAARPYFPNRTTPVDPTTTLIHPANSTFAEDLLDIHGDSQWQGYDAIKVTPTNRETNNAVSNYVYRPVRANYTPVLLGVSAIYSLVYTDNKLKMVVDPFFIMWNPYNTGITADKFAVTVQGGFAGGMRFRVTDANNNATYHGRASNYGNAGSDTYFLHYAKHKFGGGGWNLSYLVSNLSMEPGEVKIYSPPNETGETRRSANANVLQDELLPGLNYNNTDSGIFFDEFPDAEGGFTGGTWGGNWDTIPGSNGVAPEPVIDADSKIDIVFTTYSQNGIAIINMIETNIPDAGSAPEDLTTEVSYGNNVSSQEYRLNYGGGQTGPNIDTGNRWFGLSYNFSELSGTKKSFGMLSMLTMPSDYAEADRKMEVFSQLNVTPTVRTQLEIFYRAPYNIVVKTINGSGINNLLQSAGISLDGLGDGDNAFYGKDYSLVDGDTSFPLIDIPKAPLHSLVQLSAANIGISLFEPTHAIGNSWKPPYVPWNSIYQNSTNLFHDGVANYTRNDVSWQANDALFDRYFLSGITPDFNIGAGGYDLTSIPGNVDPDPSYLPHVSACIEDILKRFYSVPPYETSPDPSSAKANPALEPYVPAGKTSADIVTELTPSNTNHDGYKKLGAYSLIKGAFNVNSTSVKAWRAFLQGNKALALESAQGTNDTGTGTPFPLASTTSNTSSNNGWEKFSRLTDAQIWDDNDTPSDLTDDTGLAVEIVNQVKARGPFMSFSDFVNRRIGGDDRSAQGAIQEAIEQAEINGNQSTGIRSNTSDTIPNYSSYGAFPNAAGSYNGNRNCATGVPIEINQANILLPLAPKLSARSDTFRIRAYGEVRDGAGEIIAQATCEAVVQRLPEYLDPNTDAGNNEPWDDDSQAPTLNAINQTYGRKFEIQSFRWLDQSEV
jgi:Tfp pilus assembly protein PilX